MRRASYTRASARDALEHVDGLLSRVVGLLDMEDDQEDQDGQQEDESDELKAALLSSVLRQGEPIAESAVDIRMSTIPQAGKGAHAKAQMDAGTFLGTYRGERLTTAEAQARYPRGDAYYLLAVPGEEDVLVDAADPSKSNWLRFLNHARGAKCNCVMLDGGRVRVSHSPAAHTTAGLPRVSTCAVVLGQVVTKRRVMEGEELLFDYGRAYWKKAYFFANSFAQTPADAVAENSAEDGESIKSAAGESPLRAAQIDKVLTRLQQDPRLRRCCYRVAPPPDGDGSGDDDGLVYFLMDEVGSRVRTVTADELVAESRSSGESTQVDLAGADAEQCCEGDRNGPAKDEANEERLDRLLKLNDAEAPPESSEQAQPEPASQDPQQAEAAGEGRQASKTARVGMALLHHLTEGVMYSLLWLREDAAAGSELISVV